MIARPKIEGIQSEGTLGQSPLSVSAVTKEDSNPSLLPKQEGGLGPECSKTGCPLFSALLSFQQLHGWNQLEKFIKMVYSMAFSVENWPICCSSWGWENIKLNLRNECFSFSVTIKLAWCFPAKLDNRMKLSKFGHQCWDVKVNNS